MFITPIYLLYIYCTFTQKKLIFHFEKTYSWPYCYLSPLYIILSHLQAMDQYILSISIACKWRKIKLTWHIAVSHLADTFITECIEHIDEIRECDQYSKGNSKWFSEMWTYVFVGTIQFHFSENHFHCQNIGCPSPVKICKCDLY